MFRVDIYIEMCVKQSNESQYQGICMNGMTSLSCLLLLFWFIASLSLQDCSGIVRISVTQPLQDPNFLVSSNGTFRLGFFNPENTTNRYVGIMFNVSKISVVWVANRDRPLKDSSGVLTISEDGNLVVLNGMKEILWSSNARDPAPNSTAQLLDNGNLILTDSSKNESLWESFLNPTDTFVRGMKAGGSGNGSIQLTSWRSQSDPSTGSFLLGVNPQQIPEVFVWNRGVLHWRTGPWDGHTFMGLHVMNTITPLRVNLITGTTYFTIDNMNATAFMHYHLSFSGDLELRVFDEKGGWTVIYSSVRSECDVYGKCGPNGICNPRRSPICSCLRGFDPRDRAEWNTGNWSGGCLRKTLLRCNGNSSTSQQIEEDGYLQLINVKVPDLSNFLGISKKECGNECLKNCSCLAYTYAAGLGCLHWLDGLIDIQQFSMDGSDLYIRVAHSELDSGRSKQKEKAIIASTVIVGCLLLAASCYIFWNRQMKNRGGACKPEITLRDSSEKSKLEELPLYSYESLANATNNFHSNNKLGQGGFGPVYKGKLLSGQEVAVKRLSNSSSQGINEFMNEVMVISKLQHRNLVRLLGCCVEKDEKMLIYEYMPNKSLDAYLFDSGKHVLLDWNKRFSIIQGISKGLLYLHRDSRLRIIHRDMKASNILLDEELNSKISDFGLARIFGMKQEEGNTNRVVGTYGYMAPEYAMGGKFSEKSDVYSFGVLLLEITSGKRNTSFYLYEENLSLLGYAWKLWDEDEAVKLAFIEPADPRTRTEILRCIHIGLLCVQEATDDRPDMPTVLSMLKNEVGELPRPNLPGYTARLSLCQDQRSLQSAKHSVNYVSLTDVQGR